MFRVSLSLCEERRCNDEKYTVDIILYIYTHTYSLGPYKVYMYVYRRL